MQQCEDWAVYQRLAGVEGVTSSRPIAAIACWLNPGADYCFVTHVRKVERWRAATVRLASSRARAGNTRSCGPGSKAPAAARRPRPSWPKPETNPQQSIFTVDNFTAIGGTGVLRNRGLQVRRDMVLVGFSDTSNCPPPHICSLPHAPHPPRLRPTPQVQVRESNSCPRSPGPCIGYGHAPVRLRHTPTRRQTGTQGPSK